uniref:Small monomeric GTPase n=1 Tax=Parastrongyloides trichosuri TaxID=131310 RepID=A0A0N4ZMG7_PARTI
MISSNNFNNYQRSPSLYRRKHRQLPKAPDSVESDGSIQSCQSPRVSPSYYDTDRPFNYNAIVTPVLRSKNPQNYSQSTLLNPYSTSFYFNNSEKMSPGQPLRSQSFRHRHRPLMEVKKNIHEENSNNERRRSTPNISRRYSLQKGRIDLVRTDVWAQPKTRSEIEERFLKLPDSEDYTRVRQFKIDAKGAVVSRGDSFRRKKNNKYENSPSPFETESSRGEGNDSRSGSIGSTESTKLIQSDPLTNSNTSGTVSQTPSTSLQSYKICLIGGIGTGKSALISQFITSEYRNTFVCENDDYDNHVSVCIGGQECELTFYEDDLQGNDIWKNETYSAYLLVYGIDSKSSFRKVLNVMDDIREINKNVPIILAGNKADLERKRNVARSDVKSAAFQYNIPHFEISVALNHDVDDLLVAIIAEIRQNHDSFGNLKQKKDNIENTFAVMDIQEQDDFRAAIRRFSQRKKKQMGHTGAIEPQTPKCSSLNPVGLIERFRQWRKGST